MRQGPGLELAHDSEGGLAGAQQQVAVGDCESHLQLLIHNAEEVHCSWRPELACLICLGLPTQVCLQAKVSAVISKLFLKHAAL